MKTWFGGAVALLGATVTICGGTALYNYAIIADETGISGWNPALWVIIFAGILISVLGAVSFVNAMSERTIRPGS